MTRQELREEIRMLHFPDVPYDRLPDPLINKLIQKAYDRVVTLGHTYPKSTSKSLVSGSYDLSGITDFYEPRWYEYNGVKMRMMTYENITQVPVITDLSDEDYWQPIAYQKGKTLYVINGNTESIDIFYWAYPGSITRDETTLTALDDQFSESIVDFVCWRIAQGVAPQRVGGYIMGYNEAMRKVKDYYIKQHRPGRGYVQPVDY